MKKLLFLITFLLLVNTVQADVVINEIMYNPFGDDNNREFVEIYFNEWTNLTYWIIADTSSNDTLSLLQFFNSSYALIVEENFNYSDINASIYSAGATIGSGLNNNGEENIFLYDSNRTLIDFVNYNDSWGSDRDSNGTKDADGEGFSLERIDPFGLSNSMSNWDSSKEINGTPGQRNSVMPEEHDLAVYPNNITFFPPDPSPRTGVNITVTIHNLGLYNETNVNVSIYNFSTLIDSRLLNITKQSTTNFTTVWNNISAGNHTILISISNVTGETNLTNNNATKNITIKFRLVINEIMYNPPDEIGPDADFEWVEIYNNASYNENLTGWFLKCDTETSTPKTKILSGTLESGKYLVLAKDVTQFYTYYSSSIQTDSQTCALNNDGEAIKLIFNDSNIYHEESVIYSNSWGADGTGYSLERADPNTTTWAESIAYSGTPGAKNNPDNKTKSSLKQTEIVYRTSTSSGGGGSIASVTTQKESDYEIVSYPTVAYVGKEFDIVVKLKSDVRKNLTVYSYVFDGRKLLSEGFDEVKWRKTWDANEKNLILNAGSTITLTLKNKIKNDVYSGDYKLRVRIVDEKDLTKDIKIMLPPEQPLTIAAMDCNVVDDRIFVDIKTNEDINATLLIFSERGMEVRNITVLNETTETLTSVEGYHYILLTQDNTILDKCFLDVEKPMGITGRTVGTADFVSRFYAWLKSILSFL